MRKIFLLFAPLFLAALSFKNPHFFTITGKIINESGQPLGSVSITHKSSKVSAVSSSDGTYTISVPEKTGVLNSRDRKKFLYSQKKDHCLLAVHIDNGSN